MRNLSIVPTVARTRFNDYAEDAVIVTEEVRTAPSKQLHFIEANTTEVTLQHLREDCVTPVFAKDNELTINHAQFVETIQDAARDFFRGETIEEANIRVSHIIKGRIPEALHKKTSELLESDKTQYYERCAFSIDIPSIYQDVCGNRLNLSIVGVRAYNHENLYTKKTPELFKLAIGFKNLACCNMCIFTDGYKDCLRVCSTGELYRAALELFNNFNPAKQLHLLKRLGSTTLTEHQFCQILGRMRLYQALPSYKQKHIPRMLLTDTQVNAVSKAYVTDPNFGAVDATLTMWQFYNLLTGANKSSYVDSFLDRALNATEIAVGIKEALRGDETYKWFID